ncbi:hypothetical protein KXX49_005406 [Aspergillus fumigatus]|nr:hypothetical protein KXX49_005406 [Aspergillus fumigatus]
MLEGMPVGEIDFNAAFEGVPGINAIMTSNSMLENQQYHFEPNAFDLMNQVQNDYNKTALYQQLSPPEGWTGTCASSLLVLLPLLLLLLEQAPCVHFYIRTSKGFDTSLPVTTVPYRRGFFVFFIFYHGRWKDR